MITFGLHTEEEIKPYELPQWDIDKAGNLVDRFPNPESDEGQGESEFEVNKVNDVS